VVIGKSDPVKYANLVAKYGFKGTTAIWMPNGAIISNKKSVESAKLTIEWASTAGIPVVNTGDGYKDNNINDEDTFKYYKDRMSQILETAEKHRVFIALEPHGTFSLTGDGLEKLVSFSDSPWLGINYDGCNINRAYYVESSNNHSQLIHMKNNENECDVLKRIVKKVVHVHAKDMRDGKCTALSEGTVDIKGCLEILKESKYDGAVSLETEGDEDFGTTCEIARKGLNYLRTHGW
jgi:sugar phosphate isomerase/epimerase